MNTPPNQPTLDQQVFDVRLQLDKAHQSIINGRPVNIESILSSIKILTDDLIVQMPDISNEKRTEMLENLKVITLEVDVIEKALIKSVRQEPESNTPNDIESNNT